MPIEIAGGRITAASSLTRVYLLFTNFTIIFTLWFLVQTIDNMEQCIAGHHVGIGLSTSLGIEGAGDVAELSEYVEAVENHEQPAFQEGTREAGVPDEVVGVERLVGVAGAGIKAEVG